MEVGADVIICLLHRYNPRTANGKPRHYRTCGACHWLFDRAEKRIRAGKAAPRTRRTVRIDPRDAAWSLAVRTRDNFTCQKCGTYHGPTTDGVVRSKTRGGLDAAHIFSRRFRATRWDIDNGISLCVGCHRGWAHTHPAEFLSWVKTRIGGGKFEALRMKARGLEIIGAVRV